MSAIDKYLKLLRDLRDAWKAGDWKKVYALTVEIAIIVRDILTGGEVSTMSVEQSEEASALVAEVRGLVEGTALPADAEAAKIGDGKLAAWLVKIVLIVIGIPVPFEAQ